MRKQQVEEKRPQSRSLNDYMEQLLPTRPGERELGGLKLISRDRIKVKEQPRRAFPKAERDELARSIRELRARNAGIEGTGILLPLLVLPDEGDGYPLIAGQRRYIAAGGPSVHVVSHPGHVVRRPGASSRKHPGSRPVCKPGER